MRNEKGNVFMIVLVAVILFAALMFVFSSGLNTGTTKVVQSEGRAHAADIITTAARYERAVQKILTSGVSETDISFDQGIVSGYSHGSTDAQQVFGTSSGGGLSYREPLPGQATGTNPQWLFTGGVVITGLGDDNFSELLATLPVSLDICQEINKQLKHTIDITTNLGNITGDKFTGSYADDPLVAVVIPAAYDSGCFRGLITDGSQTGTYTFFKVLHTR